MRRLLVLVPKPVGVSPGQRFRLEQWAPHLLARHDIKLEFAPFESPGLTEVLYQPGRRAEKALRVLWDTWRRRKVLRDARQFDGVVLYREAALLGPAIYERLLARAGIPTILDFDDAIWLPSISAVNGAFSALRFAGKTATICRLATAVVAGNSYLAAYARRHSAEVFIVPTTIELARYALQPEPLSSEPFTVVWSGSLSTLVHFEHARPALEALGGRRPTVVRIIGNQPPQLPIKNVENVFVPWREAGEAEALGRAHVGIMPMPDDPFSRGKCALKALQYMAVGVPVVVSPVGVNAEVVRDGRNGLHARSTSDWLDAFDRLAGSADLRRDLRLAARKTVVQGYCAEVGAEKFAAVVTHAVGRADRGRRAAWAGHAAD